MTSVRSVHISCFCSILSGIILGYVEKCFLDRGLPPVLLPVSSSAPLLPLSFFSPCPRSTSLSPPLILEPIARTGRNMSSFLANLTSALMQPPCSSHDFDPRNHRHSTPLFALFLCLSTWTNNIRENCLIPKYTHIPSRRWLSNDAKIDVIRLD